MRGGALLGVALLLAASGAGCGTGGLAEGGSTSAGQQLFTERCGQCHTLRAAGTQGTIGPNLDEAFAQSREDGVPDSTFENVVRDQIQYPVPPQISPLVPPMPENLVEGEDADSVAAYVASVAANPQAPVAAPPPPPPPAGGGGGAEDGEAIFSSNCASCHTLAAANASGTIGPNLDDAKPDEALVVDRVTNGKDVMPSFKGKLTDAQIQTVAAFVSQNAGQ